MEDDELPTMFTMLGDHDTDLGVGSGALPRRPVLEDAVLEAGLKNLSAMRRLSALICCAKRLRSATRDS